MQTQTGVKQVLDVNYHRRSITQQKIRLRCISIFQAQISLKVTVESTFMCFNFQST